MLVLLGWRRSNGDRYKDAFAVPEVLVGANAYPVPRLLHTRLNAGHNPLEDLAIAVLLGPIGLLDEAPGMSEEGKRMSVTKRVSSRGLQISILVLDDD